MSFTFSENSGSRLILYVRTKRGLSPLARRIFETVALVNMLLADADPLRDLQPRNALGAEQDHPRPACVSGMGRAASDQSLESLSLAWFEVNVSHARTNRACTRKFPLTHMRCTMIRRLGGG